MDEEVRERMMDSRGWTQPHLEANYRGSSRVVQSTFLCFDGYWRVGELLIKGGENSEKLSQFIGITYYGG